MKIKFNENEFWEFKVLFRHFKNLSSLDVWWLQDLLTDWILLFQSYQTKERVKANKE